MPGSVYAQIYLHRDAIPLSLLKGHCEMVDSRTLLKRLA